MSPPASEPSGSAPALEGPSDEALLAACAAGEVEALGALHDRHYAALRAYAARLLGWDHPEQEDLVQQLFLAVWDSAARYRPEVSVRAWMFGIGANLARRQHQRQQRTQDGLRRLAAQPLAPAGSQAPDEAAALGRLVAALPEAVAALPLKLRVVYVMVQLEGVAGTEAAAALGLKPGTVWRRMHEARRALRDRLLGD